jgi:hypothetical protein
MTALAEGIRSLGFQNVHTPKEEEVEFKEISIDFFLGFR